MNTRYRVRKRKFTFASSKPANFYHRLTKLRNNWVGMVRCAVQRRVPAAQA